MSARFMLDTASSFQLLEQRPLALLVRLNAEADRLALSTVTLMELLTAATAAPDAPAARRAVEDFASRFEVLPFDRKAAQHAADLEAELDGVGGSPAGYELLVAAHARSQGLVLVTSGRSALPEIRGLALEQWT